METKTLKFEGFDLNLIKTEKFKTISLVYAFRRSVKIEDLPKLSLLVDILHLGSNTYKTEKELVRKRKDNYSQTLRTNLTRKGNSIEFSVSTNYINPKYIKMETAKDFLDFINDVVFNQGENGVFTKKNFDIVYKELINNIETIKDRPGEYAARRLVEVADKDELYTLPSYGYIEDLKKIKVEDLISLYDDMLKNDYMEITVAGDIEEEDYIQNFSNFKRINPSFTPELFTKQKLKKTVIEEKEEFDSFQSKLKILLKIDNVTEYADMLKIVLLNIILGGNPSSKLFTNVREKNSLCYSVSSRYSRHKNTIVVTSGINKENYELAKKLILEQIDSLSNDISDSELEAAKTYLIDSIVSNQDRLGDLIADFRISKLESLPSDEEEIKMIKKIKIEDLFEISSNIKLDTIFLLEGGKDDKNS